MAGEEARNRPERGGARGGRGGARGGRGGARGPKTENKEWVPVTKLGRLVKDGKVKSLEEIYRYSMPVKEVQIIDHFFPAGTLKEEVVKVSPVQKQTQAGQRTRFRVVMVIGDCAGHIGLGVKCSKEVNTAISGALTAAKLSMVPVRLGYWGTILGEPHTVPAKVSGKCGSVLARLVPAPRGTSIVAAPVIKRLLELAGVSDCYTQSTGRTRTNGNFVRAVFYAITKTCSYTTPDMWADVELTPSPFETYSDHLARAKALIA